MFAPLLERLQRREDLSTAEAAGAMAAVMDGRATPAQIAGLLVALRMKGECPDEIVGFARAMRDRSVRLSKAYPDAFDTCGTGGDGGGTFNVSTVVALVLAACGVTVAKHGNRSVSSRCGSADLLAALGVNVSAAPAVVERCLDRVGMAFLFAPTFHPSMRHAAEPRRDLGVRTAFNLLGPLTNPAGVKRQLVAPTASTRSRRAATPRSPSVTTAWCGPSTCIRRKWACPRPSGTTWPGATPRRTPPSPARFSPATAPRVATSSC